MKQTKTFKFDNSGRLQVLGFAIAYYRKTRKLSQEQLAEMLGISRQHMGAIEAPNMNRGLSLELVLNIASVLDIEPYQLFMFPFGFPPESPGVKKTIDKP